MRHWSVFIFLYQQRLKVQKSHLDQSSASISTSRELEAKMYGTKGHGHESTIKRLKRSADRFFFKMQSSLLRYAGVIALVVMAVDRGMFRTSTIKLEHESAIGISHQDQPSGSAIGSSHQEQPSGSGIRISHRDQPSGAAIRINPDEVKRLLKQQSDPILDKQYFHLRKFELQWKELEKHPLFVMGANWPCIWGVDHVVGKVHDGPKWTCGLNQLAKLPQQECVVYSFGSMNEFSFEVKLLTEFLPHCKVWTFDHTVENPRVPKSIAEKMTYLKWGLSSENSGKFKTLPTIMKELGHTHIDILKVDIEGYEWPTFFALDARNEWPSFGQLQIEIHTGMFGGYTPPIESGLNLKNRTGMMLSIIELFEKHDLRMFHEEINTVGRGECCSEYAFIQKEWSPLRRDYSTSSGGAHAVSQVLQGSTSKRSQSLPRDEGRSSKKSVSRDAHRSHKKSQDKRRSTKTSKAVPRESARGRTGD